MKKIISFFLVVVCLAFANLAIASGSNSVDIPEPIPGQSYFDKKFDEMMFSLGELKANDYEIKSILGKVFEGTVPKGGTVLELCKETGWELIPLMGHNNIVDPNVVAAGTTFTYPQTQEELEQALKRGRVLHAAWLKNQPTTFRVNRMKVDTAEIDELNIRVASFKEKLEIKNMEIDHLKTRLHEITEELSIKKQQIGELNVEIANLNEVNINKFKMKEGEIEDLRIRNLEIKEGLIGKLRIKQLEIDNLHQLLTLAENRCRELEARPPKVVTETKTVYKTVGGKQVYEASCDEVPFPVDGFWSTLRDGEYVEFKYRPNNSQQFKAVRVLKEDGWVKPSCRRFWTQNQISSLEARPLLDTGEELRPALSWELPEGDGGTHKTYMVMAIE